MRFVQLFFHIFFFLNFSPLIPAALTFTLLFLRVKASIMLTLVSTQKSDVADLQESSPFSSDSESESDADPITAERKRRAKKQDHLRRSAGEPQKPDIKELNKLKEPFLGMLRMVLAD